MKLVLSGPPRSGKSCFREALKQAIRALPGAPYPYVITACPDGEGAWFQATVARSPDLAAACKAAYKAKFTPQFVRRVKANVEMCNLPLVLIDIGGVPSDENRQICASADAALILSGDPAQVPVWRDFWASLGIPVVAEIYSDYHGRTDVVRGVCRDGVWRGTVHYLERGVDCSERPCIRAFAEWLVTR